MSKKILTLTEQRHIWSTLSETFSGLTQQEKYDIIKALGLDGLIGEDGSYIPFYSMDIHSSRPTYITNQFDTKLTANLYNYTEDISSDVTEWKWERISGNKEEDERWAVGKNTRELDLTYADFTDRFTVEQDITFKVSATIKGKTVTDEIIFSKILYFSKVQIVSDKNVFIESTPEKIRLSFTTDITVDSIRWYIDNRFLSASETFELGYNLITLGGSATIKLEVVEEVTGKVFTDSLTIPRISNGTDGEPGVPGTPGSNSYTWIKYADGPNGEGMDEYPFKTDGTVREYIGMATGKDSPTESNDPTDYTWTKYIGTDGIPGESVLSSIVFKRSANAPAIPTGGNYFNPVPSGWSDGIPDIEGDFPVWMSTRVFTLSGNAPQDRFWSEPQITSDTATIDFDWSSSNVEDPGTPDAPLNGAVWEEISSTESIWMAIQRTVNGDKKPWEVKKIKGEKGEYGQSILTSFIFKRAVVLPTTPNGGNFLNPIPSGWSDGIPAELNGMPLWMSSRVMTSDGLAPQEETWSTPVLAADTVNLDFEWTNSTANNVGTPSAPLNGAVWTNESSINSVWMAVRKIENGLPKEWNVSKIKGEEGQGVITSFVFKRSPDNSVITTKPTGGSFENPIPSGWSDGIPSGVGAVYQSVRKFTKNGLAPQEAEWSTPTLAQDTQFKDYAYSNSLTTPIAPPNTQTPIQDNSVWHNSPEENDIWQAVRTVQNLVYGPWTVQRIKGEKGEDSYMWIKFSEYPLGRATNGTVSMFDTPFIIKPNGEREDMVYMGIAYNKKTKTEADPNTPEGAPEQYVWAKIRGEDGRTPYTLDLSNDNVSVPANSSGVTGSTAFNLAKTDIKLYYGNDVIDPSEYTLSFIPINVTYALSNNNHHLQITGMTGTTGEIKIEARANNKLLTTATFSIVKVVGTATYEILPSTSVIKIVNNYTGGDQEIQPTSIDVKIKKNTGESVDTVNEGRLTYRYIYASSVGSDDDGVNIPIDQILEIDNSGNPLFLEFKYFHPVTNAMVDRETIPFVRDGVSANTTELRFRVTNTSTIIPSLDKLNPNPPDWTVTQPTVPSGHVLWMTRAVKKANGDLIGQWSDPIIFIGMPGTPGSDGPPGPPGMSGTIGPSPRTFEWFPGAQYQVGEGFIDYAYYRGTGAGDPCLGWYVVKLDAGKTIADYNTTAKKVIANASGCPDSNLFVKAPFSGDMTFSTIIAEQANLAGFIFRNQVLYSQSITSNFNRCTQITKTVPNLILDGFQGIINFADRMILKSDGVYLYDSCERVRLKIRWDESTGVPIIEYVGPNGETTWTPNPSEINTYVEVRAVKVSNLNVVSEGVILPELQPFLCKKGLDSGLPVIATPLPLIGYGYYGSRTPDMFDVYQGMNSLGPKLDSSYNGDYVISLKISNYAGGGAVKVSVKYAKILNGVLTVQRILLPTYYTISNVQNNC